MLSVISDLPKISSTCLPFCSEKYAFVDPVVRRVPFSLRFDEVSSWTKFQFRMLDYRKINDGATQFSAEGAKLLYKSPKKKTFLTERKDEINLETLFRVEDISFRLFGAEEFSFSFVVHSILRVA